MDYGWIHAWYPLALSHRIMYSLKAVRWVDLDVKYYPVPIRHVLYSSVSVAGRAAANLAMLV